MMTNWYEYVGLTRHQGDLRILVQGNEPPHRYGLLVVSRTTPEEIEAARRCSREGIVWLHIPAEDVELLAE